MPSHVGMPSVTTGSGLDKLVDPTPCTAGGPSDPISSDCNASSPSRSKVCAGGKSSRCAGAGVLVAGAKGLAGMQKCCCWGRTRGRACCGAVIAKDGGASDCESAAVASDETVSELGRECDEDRSGGNGCRSLRRRRRAPMGALCCCS